MAQDNQSLKKMMDELGQRVSELESWKKQKTLQQISKPLDESSKNIINELIP